MVRIASGLKEEEFETTKYILTLTHHHLLNMIGLCLMAQWFRKNNCCRYPFTLAGAMAPVTIVGATIAQSIAEGLALLLYYNILIQDVPLS